MDQHSLLANESHSCTDPDSSPDYHPISDDIKVNPNFSQDTLDFGSNLNNVNPSTSELLANSVDESLQNEDVRGGTSFQVYSARWYVLGIYCAACFLQSGLCTCWSVIAQTVEVTFGWSDSTVSLMQLWYYTTYIVFMFPFAYLMDTKGLRVSMIASVLLTLGAACLRCISMTPPLTSWLNNFANFLLGLAGPVCFASGPVVSTLWFPPQERSTATAVAMMSGIIGPALSFVIGPSFIDPPKENVTLNSYSEEKQYINVDEMRRQIRYVRLGECAAVVLVFCTVLTYFPSKPPSPPSRSASLPKLNVFKGVQQLLKKKHLNFWLLCLAATISTGIYGVWSGLLDVLLKPGVSEVQAGWLGFSGVMIGCFASVLCGRLADLVSGKMKVISVVLQCGCVFSSYWFILASQQYIPYSTYQLYASVIVLGVCNNGPTPLYFEMAAETNYPISEIVTTSVLTIMYNVGPIIFLCVFVIPNIGVAWMSWCLFGSLILCVPLLLCFKESYNRLKVDAEILIVNGEDKVDVIN